MKDEGIVGAAGPGAIAGTPAVPDVFEQSVTVRFSFPVRYTRGLFRPDNGILKDSLTRLEPGRQHRILAVIDDGVAAAWPNLVASIEEYAAVNADALRLVAPPQVLQGGESAKNSPELVQQVVGWIHQYGIDRQSFIVCVGGGSLLDAVGYAAAIAHRGVRMIRIPTTVLAQNDSGVGVKNGVNAFGKKNFIGTFAPPFAVLSDFDFLSTLPRRDVLGGMSEAVKVALIKDANFFAWIEENASSLAAGEEHSVEYLIRRCAQMHLNHIATSGDPFELGSASPLDFGHWAAHKLESMSGHRVSHGEAVAIGLALDTLYSARSGILSHADAERVLGTLERLGLRLWDATLDERDETGSPAVLAGLREFREHLGGELSVTLLSQIGRGLEANEIDLSLMQEVLEQLSARDEARCA